METGLTDRILNLDDSNVSLYDLRKELRDYPIPGLKEIIVIRKGRVIPFFPYPVPGER
jgi:hypothetical protein